MSLWHMHDYRYKQVHKQCAMSHIFAHTQTHVSTNTSGLLPIGAIWQRIIFFHLDLPLLIFMKTMTHCLSADSQWWICILFLLSLLSLSILLCLIHGNYARECADVRLTDCCIFHRRLELTVKCLISCGFISTCLTISNAPKKACWGMLRGHVSNLLSRRHPGCCQTAGLVFSVAKVPALTKWRNFTGGMGRSVSL